MDEGLMVAVPALFFLFFGLVMMLSIAGLVFWVVALVDVVRIPDHQFRAAGTEKVTWVLIVALAQSIGALIWWFAKRREVHAAAGWAPPLPPGWYPDPATGAPRWWDGGRWVDPWSMAAPTAPSGTAAPLAPPAAPPPPG